MEKTQAMKDLNYHGFAHELSKTDKRLKRYAKQRKERGFDDTELWGLDYTIACFVLPRLREFAAEPMSFPGMLTYEEWKAILNEIVVAFEILARDDDTTKEEDAKIEKGLELFALWYRHLWI